MAERRITLFHADCIEKEWNKLYPHKAEICSCGDLAKAITRDNVICQFKDFHRGNENFISANAIIADLDNSHSEEPSDWYRIDDICDTFPDVCFYYVESRNHMRDKVDKYGVIHQARPKYHLYFPTSRPVESVEAYEFLSYSLGLLFPVFDHKVADPAHFLFGIQSPVVKWEEGEICIDEYLHSIK